MNRYIRSFFSLTTLALIVLYWLSSRQSLLSWSCLVALTLIYLALIWIPQSWWTLVKHVLAVSLITALVIALHLSVRSTTVPESLLLVPLVLLLAREQQDHRGFFVGLAVAVMVVMSIIAPVPAFTVTVMPVVIALYMSVRAINIYKSAYRVSLQNIDELNAANRELQQTYAALQEATVHSMRYAALAERTRLAQDIHDGLGHQLTSLIVQLQALEVMLPGDPVQAAGVVPGMLEVARKAMAEVHQAVRTWREEETSDGLVALQGLVSQSAAHAPFTLTFTQDQDLSDWSVDLSVALYRILQEALTNVLRHAQASAVEVRVQEQADHVILIVSDDGRYAGSPPLIPGYGIKGMMERCQILGGTCQILQNRPHGLNLRVSIPITPSRTVSIVSPERRQLHE